MKLFKKNRSNTSKVEHADHKMYIFTLRGPSETVSITGLSRIPIEVYTVHEGEIINDETEYIAPVITTDGNIVFLPVGKTEALHNLQDRISSIASSQIHANNISQISIGSFAVVGTSFRLPAAPNISCEIYRVLTYEKALPEYEQIYAALMAYCENADSRTKIQEYFAQELQKKWINNVIAGIKQRLNWNMIVSNAIDETYKEAEKHEKPDRETVRFTQIDEDGSIVK